MHAVWIYYKQKSYKWCIYRGIFTPYCMVLLRNNITNPSRFESGIIIAFNVSFSSKRKVFGSTHKIFYAFQTIKHKKIKRFVLPQS